MLVGTSLGAVMIFDSKSADLLDYLSCHTDPVHVLVVLPQQIRSCICAEISFQEAYNFQEPKSTHVTSEAESAIVASIGKGTWGYCVPAEWEDERSVNYPIHEVENVLLVWELSSF